MRKVINAVYIASFLLILIVSFCGTDTRKGVASDFDNRMLVEFPKIGQENYEAKVESYLRDRIGFRDCFVTGFQRINDAFAGELTHPIYTYGRDGYMFFNMHYNVQYSEYHDLFVSAVVKMKEYCEARGVPFYFMFEPEKISVYRQYLPRGVNYNDEWVDELLSKLREKGVTVVDNREMLTRISAREQVFNRQYDAGHWNDIGAFYATNNLWATISKDFPAVTLYTPEEFAINTTVAKYLPSSKFSVNEEIPDYSLEDEWIDLTNKVGSVKRDSRYRTIKYLVNISDDAGKYPKMLVFHGSYYNRCPEFFIGRASEYLGVHDYQNVLNLDYYFTLFQPEMVVFEVAEYTVDNQYFSSRTMEAIDFPPGLSEEASRLIDEKYKDANEVERVYITSSWDLDRVYFERELPFARYVYINAGEKLFDLHRDEHGLFYAQVVHGSVAGDAVVYYEDFDGIIHGFPVKTVTEQRFEKQKMNCSEGVEFDADNRRYVFKALSQSNLFDMVSLQLLKGDSGEYLETLDSITTVGGRKSEYLHLREEGWYRLRLKANGNEKDESVELLAYLLQGKRYHFGYYVRTLQEKIVTVENVVFSGPCKWIISPKELVTAERIETSKGVSWNGDSWKLVTDRFGNAFNMVVLNVIDSTTGEQGSPITVARTPGEWKGEYIHSAKSGEYYIRLRGNSNLEDEFVTVKAVLKEGMIYDWSFTIDMLSAEIISIHGFSLKEMGKEGE